MYSSPNSSEDEVLILGCGYTGQRVALSLLSRGIRVTATTRNPAALASLAERGASVLAFDLAAAIPALPSNCTVLYSIPAAPPAILDALAHTATRIVYISTTGVYGEAKIVNENTPASPATARERMRFEVEQAVISSAVPSLILRPAAIYGPGRGVHASMRAGSYRIIEDGGRFVSRIHVEDLAAHAEAAMFSSITGAYPVADEEPCTSREIAAFCAELLGLPMPPSIGAAEAGETRRGDRRVDGRAIREKLGIGLRYPSYRTGIPACLEAEGASLRRMMPANISAGK